MTSIFFSAESSCNFTDDLLGTWLSSQWDGMTFTPSQVTVADLDDLGRNVVFNCDTKLRKRYLLRSASPVLTNGSSADIVTCLFMNHTLSGVKYHYYHATSLLQLPSGASQPVRLVEPSGSPITISDTCTVPDFLIGSHDIMVKTDQFSAARENCPKPLLGNFYNYTVVVNENTTACDGSGSITVCDNDTRTLVVDYAQCPTTLFYSSSGTLSCVHWVSDGFVYYVNLLNTDVTVDNSETFRFTCVVLQHSHGTTFASQWPRGCHADQSPKSVPTSRGLMLFLKPSEICYVEELQDELTLLFIIMTGVMAVLLLLLCIGRYRQQHPSDVKLKEDKDSNQIASPRNRPDWTKRKTTQLPRC